MIWILLVIYQLKHFFADYPLQGKYMLGKFKPYPDFILPLMAHAGVHFAFTFLIVLACGKGLCFALSLGLLDFGIHFVVDRIKASPKMLGRFKALSAMEYLALIGPLPQRLKKIDMAITPVALCGVNDEEVKDALKSNVLFWWALGWDQMMHHLTHYLIIYLVLS